MKKVLGLLLGVLLSLSFHLLKPATSGAAQVIVGTNPTFNREVVRILQNNCQVCHRPGDIAPFSLMTYSDVFPRAERIKQVTQARIMPPWKPVDGCSQYMDTRKLSDEDIRTISRWVDAGAPQGAAAELPPPAEFQEDGWQLGTPDMILTPEVDYMPNPQGGDAYRCYVIRSNLPEGRFVTGIDVRPGNRKIVHHVLLFTDTTGASEALDLADPEPGYTCFGGPGFLADGALGGWAPGNRPMQLPEGVGIYLPANARVVMQVHYHPNGQQETDRSRVALYFARGPIQKEFYVLPLINTRFVIPAGAERHEVKASFTLPSFASAHLLSIAPHMHLLGREMRVRAVYTDKSERCLINIDDWDFQWQGTYFYTEPVPLPGGTKLELSAYYDNSDKNPRNPNNPPKDTTWGEATTDEMCIAFLGFTLDSENLLKQWRRK